MYMAHDALHKMFIFLRILVFSDLYGCRGMGAALVLRGFQTIQVIQTTCMVERTK
jgi:hypothetical protein